MASGSWWSQYVRDYLPLGIAIASAIGYMREARRRKFAEKRMEEIQRRGRAPFLYAELIQIDRNNTGYDPITGSYEPGFEPVFPGQVLSPMLNDGVGLTVFLSNQGEHVREVQFCSSDGLHLTCIKNELKCGLNSGYLKYDYKKERRGKEERFTIEFCTMDGLKLRQIYAVVHGQCEIRRIDPP